MTTPTHLAGPQVREFHTRAAATGAEDAREVEGIGVPFGETYEAYGFRERFDPECVFTDVERARVAYRHGDVIGRITSAEREDAGLRIVGKLSTTPAATDALTLVRDETLDSWSIGFSSVRYRIEREDDTEVIVHEEVRVREFSLVPYPAYKTALITDTREEGAPMPPATITPEQLDQAREEDRAVLTREFETIVSNALAGVGNRSADVALGAQWSSAGDFLQACATSTREDHAAALDFHREYTGGKLADAAPRSTWIADQIRLVDERRPITNAFTRAPLPAEGMRMEYVKLNTNTLTVTQQAAEGDPLPYGKVVLKTDSAEVVTYGGATSLSLQTIQRSSTSILNTTLSALDIQYAKTVEAATRALLVATIAQQRPTNKITLGTPTDVFAWLDATVDAYEQADLRGFVVAGLLASKDVFKQLYRLTDSHGDPIMQLTSSGPAGTAGVVRASQLSASLLDVEVSLIPNAPAKTAAFYDPIAITTWEQGGAPVQLQDENVINLTKEFSKYGYAAHASQFPTALQPIAFPA